MLIVKKLGKMPLLTPTQNELEKAWQDLDQGNKWFMIGREEIARPKSTLGAWIIQTVRGFRENEMDNLNNLLYDEACVALGEALRGGLIEIVVLRT